MMPVFSRSAHWFIALLSLLLIFDAHVAAQVRKASAIEDQFTHLKKSPLELYAFLYRMPKGADLHNHLSGAVYAETFLKQAAADHLCIDLKALSLARKLSGSETCQSGQVDAVDTQTDNQLENEMIDSLSMRDFVPGAESAHDHFFATFGKFSAESSSHTGLYLADVVRRAADQNESYLELMAFSGGRAIGHLGMSVGVDEQDLGTSFNKLQQSGLKDVVANESKRIDEAERERIAALGCDRDPQSPPCRVSVRYIFEVAREEPKASVFAQVIAGFALAAADARVVAVNFVQPEDGLISMRDYHAQMLMIQYAHSRYPKVHITLHAGELAPGLVPPAGLRFHIKEAVDIGHAERIGHGVDVMYEEQPRELLKEMHDKRIAVEINLTSNDVILGVRGKDHPFPVYLAHGVPVSICTDDEGVSRTQLTQEYERAVLTYDLSYAQVKDLVRNSLEYSFLPGASYWRDSNYARPIAACVSETTRCKDILEHNEKARLQADLEQRFRTFEHSDLTPDRLFGAGNHPSERE
jgi:adenosine deaminase